MLEFFGLAVAVVPQRMLSHVHSLRFIPLLLLRVLLLPEFDVEVENDLFVFIFVLPPPLVLVYVDADAEAEAEDDLMLLVSSLSSSPEAEELFPLVDLFEPELTVMLLSVRDAIDEDDTYRGLLLEKEPAPEPEPEPSSLEAVAGTISPLQVGHKESVPTPRALASSAPRFFCSARASFSARIFNRSSEKK